MQEQDENNLSAILDELIATEKGLMRISQLILDEIKNELESISGIGEKIRNDRQKAMASFENFDQKANQLYKLLSRIMKSMGKMRCSVIRNLL